MRLLVTCLLMILSTSMVFVSPAQAKHGDPPPPTYVWTCTAVGQVGFGPPYGEVWQTVTGSGSSQGDATDRAIRICVSSGFRSCSMQNCWRHR